MKVSSLVPEEVVASKVNGETCRLCLRPRNRLTAIFAEEETSRRLRSRILDCCPVELVQDIRLPSMICHDCEEKVAATYEFRELCRQTERTLRLRYGSCYAILGRSSPGEREGDECPRTSRARKEEVEGTAKGSSDHRAWSEEEEGSRLDRLNAEEGKDGREIPSARFLEDEGRENNCGGTSVARSDESTGNAIPGGDAKAPGRYLCDICSRTFASKSGLRFHLKSHSGAKPHLCRYCDKGFAIPSYLKRHERTHSADKRFACQLCSARFASPNGLRYHSRSHTGEANYHCDICGKSFRRRKYLTEHAFTHTGEKPYVCKACGSSYGNSGSLFAHEKRCKNKR